MENSVAREEGQQGATTEHLGVRLPVGTKDRIKAVAAIDHRNTTSWVQKVIDDALKAAEKRKPN